MSVASLAHLTFTTSRPAQAASAGMARTGIAGPSGDCTVQELSANESLAYSREGMTVHAKAYIDGTPAILVNDKFTADSRTYVVRAIKVQRRVKKFTVLILEFDR